MLIRKESGITLTEILVGLTIIGLLTAIAAPNFSTWMQSVEIRSVAESLLNGMQLARAEAVRQNLRVQFTVQVNGDWTVLASTLANPSVYDQQIQVGKGGESGGKPRVGADSLPGVANTNFAAAITPGTNMPASIIFSPMGRVVTTSTYFSRIDVTDPVDTKAKRMVIVVTSDGLVRLCDPSYSLASNPRGCA